MSYGATLYLAANVTVPVVERVNVPVLVVERVNVPALVYLCFIWKEKRQAPMGEIVRYSRFHLACPGPATTEWQPHRRTALRAVIPRLGESSDCLQTVRAGPRSQWKREKRAKAPSLCHSEGSVVKTGAGTLTRSTTGREAV
jgi:hypothetical protein